MVKASKLLSLFALSFFLACNVSAAAYAEDTQTQDVSASATQGDTDDYADYYSDHQTNDPLESVNRAIFKFNEAVDFILLKPIAKTYVFVVPSFGRERVTNALYNLGEPVNMLNGFLQGDPERGFTSLWRFILNSTFGVLGLFDFAGENTDLVRVQEDFGQTMGKYGIDSGPYLVLPIIGASSVRDGVGLVADALSNPFNYVENDAFVYGRLGANIVDARARNLDLVDEIYRNSLDPYATIRSAYLQRREALVENQKVPDSSPEGADHAQ